MDMDGVELSSAGLVGLWDFSDPSESGRRFGVFRRRAEDAGLMELVALTDTQRARAMGLERRFEDGLGLIDSIERVHRRCEGELAVRVWLERGRLLNSSGEREASIPKFERAWELARGAGLDGLAVDAAHMLGIVVEGDRGMEWNRVAMELAVSSEQPDARKWRGSLLNNMGWSMHEAGAYEEALALFESALAVRIEEGEAGKIRVGRWCVGRCLRSLGRLEEAMAVQRGLEREGEGDGYVFEEIGELLLLMGRGDESGEYFAQAHRLLGADDWLVAQEPARIDRLGKLGGIVGAGGSGTNE